MAFILTSGAATRVGARKQNEDGYVLSPRVLAVADGMGGHKSGDVASALAVAALTRLAELPRLDREDVVASLRRCSDDIFVRSREQDSRRMGTTVTGLALVESPTGNTNLLVFNAGDSRTYLLRDGALTQVTKDHSIVQELIDAGELDAADARAHPQRNIVTRALGTLLDVDIDTFVLSPAPGDRLLICSDGVTAELTDGELRELLESGAAGEAAEVLVDAALAAGTRDNVTAVVADVVSAIGSQDDDDAEADDTQPRRQLTDAAAALEPPWAARDQSPLELTSIEIDSVPWQLSALARSPE